MAGGGVVMTDWWDLIDKRAALKEQFPSLAKLRHERPGSKTDQQRQAFHREQNHASLRAEQDARWERSVAANAARRERNKQRAANAAYNARRTAA